ncbi:response regulator transcription factor [Priestia endophytica]|jgi:DNA-binding response OmpR family regulator|uniref:DNA-binding response regulator n=1 Tax=Priestia endophytica TaxID=135735 RepID=A0AAX1QDD6_9BACI|nr:response regulator transcription factor [Priestia endophytica]RAS82046.1 DNA-binding response regulator [Priestia endophytica]RAS84591.1 DNA-binding response regulator [Priestia endophytica]
MGKILVLEDESAIRSFIVLNLKKAGYDVTEAHTGEQALELMESSSFDIALLDVMLPGIDGFSVCERIRQKNELVGIIMLTARTQDEDKVEGLTIGADDYITKPFSPSELTARIHSLLRRLGRIQKRDQDIVKSGPFELYLVNEVLKKRGEEIDLTPTEFCLMQEFMSTPKELFSRHELLDRVWGEEYIGDPKVVDVNIRRLRRKIEDNPSRPTYIETVWGRGYYWKGEGE